MILFFLVLGRVLVLVVKRAVGGITRARTGTSCALSSLAILLLGLTPSTQAQRNFTVTVAPTNQNRVVISWKAQSATPVGDLVVVPQFVVHRSQDLNTWTPISGMLSGTLNQTLSLVDSNTSAVFYRVQSVIEMEYAELNGAKLASSELTGADFFGARLLGADLDEATLAGVNFSGADLRSADFSGADLRGADLFNAEASTAIFDS